MNISPLILKPVRHLLLFLWPLLIPLSVMADETEIFYESEKAKVNTNVLFLLDASGSMLEEVPGSGGKDRMQVMQETFREVLEAAPDHLNIGLMNYANADFLSSYQWDSLKGVSFPISPLNGDASSVIGSYSAVDNLPDPTTGTPVRTFLADVVDKWEAKGYTPIVDSLYEAARYFRGEASVWGKYPAAYNWAAHPSSYTGNLTCNNPVTQECRLEWGECNGSQQNCDIKAVSSCCNWIEDASGGYCENNDYSCSTDITHCEHTTCDSVTGDMTYNSPMEYSCQPNFLVLMSDGKPEYPYFSSITADGTGHYPKSSYPDYTHDSSIIPGLSPAISSIQIPEPVPALISSSCADKPSGFASGTCGPELVNFLATEDQNATLAGDQTIETFTVAFGMADEPNGTAYLASLATAENGAYTADNATELSQALLDLFNEIDKKSYSFSSPSFSISDESLLSNGNDIYVPVFSNSLTPLWSGNLRKLRLSTNGRMTGAGGSAVLTDSGEFTDTAQDLWSAQPHGSDAAIGGAASKLPPPDSRWRRTDAGSNTLVEISSATPASLITPLMLSRGFRITDHDLVDRSNDITGASGSDGYSRWGWYDDCDGNRITVQKNGKPVPLGQGVNIKEVTTCPIDPITPELRNEILDFTRGYALTDTGEVDKSTTRKHIGDILNSKPIVVKYENKTLVLVATNEGYLHAFNADTGVEEWAFMPSVLLKNQLTFLENRKEEGHVYGLDGALSLWNYDANKDGVISASSDAADKRMLFFGLRRGGNMYYALDITDAGQPKVTWKISPDPMPGAITTGFANLGETWSKPTLSKMRVASGGGSDSEVKHVLVFGGGYDPKYDEYDRTARSNRDALGSDVYIVDALDGDLLWSVKQDADSQSARKLQHSVASDIRVLDMDNNGELDRLYFADLGGNVWRVDLGIDVNSNNSGVSFSNKTIFTKLADLGQVTGGDGDHRKFFYEPDTALRMNGGQAIMTISLGSGYRTHPLDKGDKDNFYVLLDRDVFRERDQSPTAVITHANLKVATPDGHGFGGSILDYPDIGGWYMPLKHNGEKVLSGAITFLDKILFTTFAQADADGVPNVVGPCLPLETSARAYALDIMTGQSVANLQRLNSTDSLGKTVDTRVPFVVAGGTGEILDTPQLIFSKLTDGNGGDCQEGSCQQSVSVRVGKLDIPLLDLENTTNQDGSDYSEMVDLTKLLPRLYWRDNEVSLD